MIVAAETSVEPGKRYFSLFCVPTIAGQDQRIGFLTYLFLLGNVKSR